MEFPAHIALQLHELPDGKKVYSGPVGVTNFPVDIPHGTYQFQFDGQQATVLYTGGGRWHLSHTNGIKPI